MRRYNAIQRDPAIAKAFDNIAGWFAPPSGADFAASANAQATRADAERRAWLFNNSADPTASARSSLLGIQNYGQTPSGFGKTDATNRRGQDIDASTKLRQTEMQQQGELARLYATPRVVGQNETLLVPQQTQAATGFGPTMSGIVELKPGERKVLPDNRVLEGPAPALSVDQATAAAMERERQAGNLTNQQIADRAFDKTTEARDPVTGKTIITTPGRAVREGLSPGDTDAPARTDNFVAMGPDGKSFNFLGYTRNGPNGVEVINQATGQPQPNVLRREGTQGGLSFETDGKGGVKLSTGNAAGQPTGRMNDLLRMEAEGARAVNELVPLFSNLRQDDLGVRGNVNDLLTNYGAQIAPGMARPDVAGRRNQLRATTLSLAKALLGDDRLSDADRRAAEAVSVSNGIDESLPGAQAKIASLIVLNAYRATHARSVRVGEKLPPLSPQIVGQMVDAGAIPPDVAREYVQNNFNAPSQTGGPIPGVVLPQGATAPAQAAPAAADPLAQAREAIARGAPREAVIQRLRQNGVDPGGL